MGKTLSIQFVKVLQNHFNLCLRQTKREPNSITELKRSPMWQKSRKSHDTSCMRRPQNMLILCLRRTKRYRNWITGHRRSLRWRKTPWSNDTFCMRLSLNMLKIMLELNKTVPNWIKEHIMSQKSHKATKTKINHVRLIPRTGVDTLVLV